MSTSDLSYAVREPTGLGLGHFDIHLIRQKIYEGEFHGRCEFQTAEGDWHALTEHPAFQEVLWLIEGRIKQKSSSGITRRAIGSGWKVQGDAGEITTASHAPISLEGASGKRRPTAADSAAATPQKAGGLLGRFFGGKN